jgi:hypothetical protein
MTGKGAGGHDFVRPFIMTGGRTESTRHTELRLESLVERRTGSTVTATMPSEQRSVLALCDRAISVAEISSELGIVVGVMQIIIGDLVDSGHLVVFEDTPAGSDDELDILTRITDKIRSL